MTAECPYTLQWDALPLKIVPSHGGSGPPSNTWFPGPSRVLNPNSIWIGSAVFAGLTSVTDRQTSRLFFTARLRPQFQMPLVRGSVVRIRGMMRTQHFSIRTSLLSTAAARCHPASILPLHATIGGRLPQWQTSKCISSVSFV